MNITLYKQECRRNSIVFIIFAAVLAMYAYIIVSMFDPKMVNSLKAMTETMPEIFAAFGMANIGTTLLEFLTSYLYGIILTAFPAVYIIIISNRLVVRYIDTGSMAYLLSVPETRRKLIRTQAIFSISNLAVLLLYVVILIIACSQLMFPGELDIFEFISINIGLFALWIMFGGVCFFFSCIFNESKFSSGFGTAFIVYTLLLQMLSQVGDKFNFLKYFTPITLFQPEQLSVGNTGAWIECIIMFMVGIIFYILGTTIFTRRDLPI